MGINLYRIFLKCRYIPTFLYILSYPFFKITLKPFPSNIVLFNTKYQNTSYIFQSDFIIPAATISLSRVSSQMWVSCKIEKYDIDRAYNNQKKQV